MDREKLGRIAFDAFDDGYPGPAWEEVPDSGREVWRTQADAVARAVLGEARQTLAKMMVARAGRGMLYGDDARIALADAITKLGAMAGEQTARDELAGLAAREGGR